VKNISHINVFVFAIVAFVVMFVVLQIVGFLWYDSETFRAKVESIEYYGRGGLLSSTKGVVAFDNGVVVDVWEVPKVLRVGGVYDIDYRTPYFGKDSYLVVISE